MAKVERACIEKTRSLPDWFTRAIERERQELAANIPDPVKRRMAELEIDAIETRVRTELAGEN